MNLEKELNEMLSDESSKKRLLKVALEAMEERVTQQFKWSLPDTIAKECNDFITEHVAPEVRAHLLASKGPIIAAAKEAADEVGEKISAQIVAKVEKNMENSWGASKVIDAMFK